MVGSVNKPVDAWNCDGTDRGNDQLHKAQVNCARSGYLAACLIFAGFCADADPIRIATYNTELSRDGPGLLLRDIERGDEEVSAVLAVIETLGADVLALQGIDWDYQGRAATALNRALDTPYPYLLTMRPNSGMATMLDMNGDGQLRGAEDAQGYGRFSGHGGMMVLSRLPILTEQVVDLSGLLWQDLPGARLPVHPDGSPFPSPEAQAVQRLSSRGHWVVPLETDQGQRFTLLTFHGTPPVFDGQEDRNGRRNADELALWRNYHSGTLGHAPPAGPIVLAGDFNLDGRDGEGLRDEIFTLISELRLQDVLPKSAGGVVASAVQGLMNAMHDGDPGLDTADWRDEAPGPGNLRVDYVLPSRDLNVLDAGVIWPDPKSGGDFAILVETASRHRAVWLDIDF